VVLASRWVEADRYREFADADAVWRSYDLPRRDTTLMSDAQQARFHFSMERIKKEHSDERNKRMLYYLSTNLAVPALLALALFVSKGLPGRKVPTTTDVCESSRQNT